jgi:ParB-like chromosome segregation protein Spo0J
MNELQVQLRPVSALIPYPKNARTHSDEQVSQIARSIEEFGWTNPILVDRNNVIIAGHARLLAAKKLKLVEVPVIVLGHLPDAQRRALVIADNQLALGAGWDEEMLRVELRMLEAEDYDLDLIGFGESELAELLADDSDYAGHADEDAVLEASEVAISVPGDLWILGDHRVFCGDATQMESIEKVMGSGLADMVFCDPPYGVAYGSSAPTKRERERRKIVNDDLGDAAFGESCARPALTSFRSPRERSTSL